MQKKKGVAVSPGICIAEAVRVRQNFVRVRRRSIAAEAVADEIERFDLAVSQAASRLDQEIQRFREELTIPIPGQVLESHRDLILDPTLREQVLARIRERLECSEFAVSEVLREFRERFRGFSSEYLAERAGDLGDIERKILAELLGHAPDVLAGLSSEVAIIARSLSPGETTSLDRRYVAGFATDVGGRTSHTAILARAFRIPAVVGCEGLSDSVKGGELVIIDGFSGQVIVDPDDKTLEVYRAKMSQSEAFYETLHAEARWPAETLDGYQISLAANIGFPDEIPSAMEWGACGVGLYRTEFLYEEGEPDEARHFESYRQAVESLGDLELVIRTLDAGADKFHRVAVGFQEPNPFLGCRSIRLCFLRIDLFRDQIRAALRVSALGRVKIMLPMVSSLEEIRSARAVIDEVRDELLAKGIPIAEHVPLGVMVEVPSLALVADRVAREVDFFSIGTNDLVGYCLAVDRGNERVAHLYQPAHPAVLRLVQKVIKAGRDAGIPVSTCGEMCSDPLYAVLLLGLGLRSLSLSPVAIPTVKSVVRQVTMADADALAAQCLECDDAESSQALLEDGVRDLLPDFF